MLSKSVLYYFKLHLGLCNRICSISLEWDTSSDTLGSLKSRWKRNQFKLHLLIAVLHNVFLVYNLLSKDNLKLFGIAYQMLAIYFSIGYCLCNGLRLAVYLYEAEIINLINAQLDFTKKMMALESCVGRNEIRKSEREEKILLTMGLTTGISVPILVLMIISAHPCLPPFVGSLLFTYQNQNNSCHTSSWFMYGLISLINFWMHLDMVLPMVFTMFGLFFINVSCVHDYLILLLRNSTQNIVSLTQPNMMTQEAQLSLYRRLQLLEKQLNSCFRHYYFPLFLIGMTGLSIFALYSSIRLPGKIPMPAFSYFPLIVANGVLSLLVMNTKAANVQAKSAKVIRIWLTRRNKPRKAWTKKVARSMTPLKIRFGSNYVDQLTPVIIINFCVNQTLSLLLIRT